MANLRSRPFLNLCRDRVCYLQLPGCMGGPTAAAHSNLQRHGRGFAYKSHDIFSVPACLNCGRALDHGKNLTKSEREDIFCRAWEQFIFALFAEGSLDVKA